jgi:hypothetical protein
MKRALPGLLLLLLVAAPLCAFERDDCRGPLTHLATLYELRSLMLKSYTSSYDVTRFIDARINAFREPLADGGYRWVRWVRPAGDGPVDKEGFTVVAVQDRGDADRFESTAQHGYSVRIVVPRKRSLLNDNKPVYVYDVEITADEETKTHTINRWMNPDTSQTFDLRGIPDRVRVAVRVATAARNSREALVETHVRQAVEDDDPSNPNYSAIRMLQRIRADADPATIDAEIAAIEESVFPGSDSIPLLSVVTDLRRADELLRSEKPEDQEKGNKLLKETLRRLR